MLPVFTVALLWHVREVDRVDPPVVQGRSVNTSVEPIDVTEPVLFHSDGMHACGELALLTCVLDTASVDLVAAERT
eukprot:1020563-Amphidinium_carterae.1